jgi:hypothetical protein
MPSVRTGRGLQHAAARAATVAARSYCLAERKNFPPAGRFKGDHRAPSTLDSQFREIAESQPELLAHHYTEAGLIEKAVHIICLLHLTPVLALLRPRLARAIASAHMPPPAPCPEK